MTRTEPARTEPLSEGVLLREIGRWLTGVPIGNQNDAIARIADILATLPQIGLPQRLVSPLRRRLAQMEMPGPLSFARLLFIPLDPVLVAAPRWRRGRIGIPRTAMAPIARQVGAAFGPALAGIETLLRGKLHDDREAIRRAGEIVWPRAAAMLAGAAMPDDWIDATGLRPADHAGICRVLSAILRSAVEIEGLVSASGRGENEVEQAASAVLESVRHADPLAPPTLIAAMVARPGLSERLLAPPCEMLAGLADPAARLAADQAVEFLLDAIEDPADIVTDLLAATAQTRRVALLLGALELPGPAQRPTRRPRIEALRRTVEAACRSRFEQELSDRVLAAAMLTTREAKTRDIAGVEAAMREVKAFEAAIRRLGDGEPYERMLRKAAGQIAALGAAPLIDRIRIVEILAGSEAALALL